MAKITKFNNAIPANIIRNWGERNDEIENPLAKAARICDCIAEEKGDEIRVKEL